MQILLVIEENLFESRIKIPNKSSENDVITEINVEYIVVEVEMIAHISEN